MVPELAQLMQLGWFAIAAAARSAIDKAHAYQYYLWFICLYTAF